MHVLMTADTVGGVWTYTRELVSGLTRRGHRVTLVSFGKLPCTSQIAWMQGVPNLDYRPTPYRLEWMQDSAEDIELSKNYVIELIAETKPDLLHFNQYAYGAIETSLPKIVVTHSDVVSWWVEVKGEEAPASEWMQWYREIVVTGLAGADLVVSPSRWMMQNVRTYYQPDVRGRVVYNGRSPSLFDATRRKENRVVSVGRLWDEAKQVSLLTKSTPSIPVTIVGRQDHPEEVFSSHTPTSPRPGVKFLGPLGEAELSVLFAKSSIYAACSCYEPFGLAPVEAALSCCALIVNDIPSFRELWGDAARYFCPNDAESLSEAIRELSANDELREKYAERAYRHALCHFSADRMLKEYEQLYGSFVAREAAA